MRSALFYYDIKDFINDNGVVAPGTGIGSNCLYNIDHFKLYGFEIEAAVRLGERLRATVAYVYKDYDVDETDFEKDWTYYLPGLLPEHKVKLLARYRVWDKGWFLLSFRYVGSRDAQKGSKLSDYATMDIGFEQNFKLYGIEYTINTFVNNITGTDYEEISGYEMPEYVWGLQLGVKF
ncbi:hypothetical protein JCM12298_31050 [Desulfothermus naphthae]